MECAWPASHLTICSYDFRSFPSALALPPPTLQRLIEDCQCVFGKDGGSEKTWWVACDGKARCALEQLALAIFKVTQQLQLISFCASHHPQEHANASYDPGCSGVEWWVQVRRGDCQVHTPRVSLAQRLASHLQQTQSIGFHWDKGHARILCPPPLAVRASGESDTSACRRGAGGRHGHQRAPPGNPPHPRTSLLLVAFSLFLTHWHSGRYPL
jgi:hypothetical protein